MVKNVCKAVQNLWDTLYFGWFEYQNLPKFELAKYVATDQEIRNNAVEYPLTWNEYWNK